MRINTKIAIAGLAGLAVISGASFYFYKKNKNSNKDQILKQLRSSLFASNSTPFTQIMSYFTTSKNIYLGSYLLELISGGVDNHGIQTRVCHSKIQKAYFYECLDCSLKLEEYADGVEEKESSRIFSHQICEDCFDHEIHKGHTYKLLEGINSSCDCGDITLIKESSFCNRHCGFKNLKNEYEEQISQEKKQLIKSYFKDMFYLLIDGQSDLIYSKMKEKNETQFEKIKTEQLNVSYNILFSLIMDQINELLDLNNSISYAIISLLQEPFEQPVRYRVGRERFWVVEEREVNNKMSVLDYLFVLQTSLNEKSIKQFDLSLELLGCIDFDFLQYISVRFLKFISFSIEKKEAEPNNLLVKSVFYNHKLSSLVDVCMKALKDNTFLKKFVAENLDNMLFIANLIMESVKTINFESNEVFNYVFSLLDYFNYLIVSLPIIQETKIVEEVIEILVDIQYTMFLRSFSLRMHTLNEVNSVEHNKKLITIGVSLVVILTANSCIFKMFQNVTRHCQNSFSKDKKEIVFRILCKRYLEQITDTHNRIIDSDDSGKKWLYHGLSIAHYLTNIIIISEGTDLSSQSLFNALKKNFEFSNDNEIYDFINKIVDVLHQNALIYTGMNIQCLDMYLFNEKMNEIPGLAPFVNKIYGFLGSSEYTIYDSNTLALQLTTASQRAKDTLIYKHATSQYHLKESQTPTIEGFVTKKIKWQINYSLLLDQTPFININRYLKHSLSSGKKDIEEKLEYIAKQVISQFIKWYPDKAKQQSSLLSSVEFCIQDILLMRKVMKQLGDFNQYGDTLNLKPLQDADLSYVYLGRNLLDNSNEDLNHQNSPCFYMKFNFSTFKYLFKFQQELLIDAIFNIDIVNFIKEIKVEEIKAFEQWDILFFYWVKFFTLNEEEFQSCLEQKQQQIIVDFKNQLLTKENYTKMKPVLERIQQLNLKKNNCIHADCAVLTTLFEVDDTLIKS